ncbi:MAG: insulinase family protein [Myxococcales bacterium]|nr:insulinase family protein [Myxococcales bacterium]
MLAAYVRVGSRHESAATNGVSHFLEHMFFRGSARYPDTVRMNALVEAAGGNLNGITTRDHCYYYTPIHPAHLGVGIAVLGDMLTRPRLARMEVEREIILEELLDEVDERGRDIDVENLSKVELFGAHPLALKIAGTPKSVRALTRRELRAHLYRHYVRGNLVFAASGQVRREEVLELVDKAFSELPAGPLSAGEPAPMAKEGPAFRFVEHDEAQTEFRLSFRTVPEQHEDFPALQLIRRVLDDGLSSRLPFHVVERKGLAYSVHASIEAFDDVGLFEVDAASAPSKAAAVVEEICRTLGELCVRKVGARELEHAKRRHRILLEFAQDSTGELAGWFGGTELFRPPESFEQRCRLIEAQSAEKLREVARRTFRRDNLTSVAVGQKRGVRRLEAAVTRAASLP